MKFYDIFSEYQEVTRKLQFIQKVSGKTNLGNEARKSRHSQNINSLAKEFRFYPMSKRKPLSNFKQESVLLHLCFRNIALALKMD